MVSVCGENLRVNSWVKWISGKFCGEKSDGFKRIILRFSGCSRAVVEKRGCSLEVRMHEGSGGRWCVRERESVGCNGTVANAGGDWGDQGEMQHEGGWQRDKSHRCKM